MDYTRLWLLFIFSVLLGCSSAFLGNDNGYEDTFDVFGEEYQDEYDEKLA